MLFFVVFNIFFSFFHSSFHIDALLIKEKKESGILIEKKALRLTFSSHLSIIPELRITMMNKANEGEKQVL
jgi:hypothetical protein